MPSPAGWPGCWPALQVRSAAAEPVTSHRGAWVIPSMTILWDSWQRAWLDGPTYVDGPAARGWGKGGGLAGRPTAHGENRGGFFFLPCSCDNGRVPRWSFSDNGREMRHSFTWLLTHSLTQPGVLVLAGRFPWMEETWWRWLKPDESVPDYSTDSYVH